MQAHRKNNHVMMEAEIGSYAAISQGTSVTIGSWKRQERTIHEAQNLDFGLTVSSTMRK